MREWGVPLDQAQVVLILLHGRGVPASDMQPLLGALEGLPVAALAPEAHANTWYPQRFTAPLHANEPWLSSALGVVGRLLARAQGAGFGTERIVLLGFSQGACLALEYAARHPARYGGVLAFSGGLIGPEVPAFDYTGQFGGTPVFIGVSDNDPHIPLTRAQESARVFARMSAAVSERLYPNTGHQIVRDEVDFMVELMAQVAARPA